MSCLNADSKLLEKIFLNGSGIFLRFLTNLGSLPVELFFEHILHPQYYKPQLFLFSDQDCHHRSDTYFLLSINVGPRISEGVLTS